MSSDFEADLALGSVSPLWSVLADLVTETPKPQAQAYAWRYDAVRALLMRAGDHITAEEAERRVLILENPGTAGTHRVTDSLYAGLQLVLPGERAPNHRHTQSALRFVLESNGAWTSVDGERVPMDEFDLVLTPNWRWHEHGGGDGPAIWLDGLDIPIIQKFSAGFAERTGNTPGAGEIPTGTSMAAFGSNMHPISGRVEGVDTPLFHYPFAKWGRALDDFSLSQDADPHFGWAMEFLNPVNGGAAMGTISAFAQKIARSTKTLARKQSAGAVYTAVSGSGALIVDGARYDVAPRDIVVVPSWSALQIEAADTDLVLFSYSDRTCHEKLGFWREKRL